MMIADFGKESSADVIKQGLASGDPTLATANLPEGGWVSNILVQGQPTHVVRDPARLEKGREALRAIQQKWDGVRALKEIAIRSANIQAEDVTSHPLVGQRILVSQPEDTTYPEPPSVRFEPAVVHYQNSLVPALRERAQSYVGRVMTELEAAGKDFRTFTTALKAHQDGELNTRGLRDLMAQLMAGHPQLMQDFESFLPRPKSNEATNNDDDRVAEHKGEHDGIEPVFVVRLTKDEQSASAGSSVSLPSLAVLKETEVSGRLVFFFTCVARYFYSL
jgi:histone deacetylase complex regulatory component SIN3